MEDRLTDNVDSRGNRVDGKGQGGDLGGGGGAVSKDRKWNFNLART